MSTETVNLNSMPANEARVAIAREVLALLAAGKIVPTDQRYFATQEGSLWNTPESDEDARSVLQRSGQCRVCQIGAMLYASVVLHDRISWNQLRGTSYYTTLARWFPFVMLREIEDWFQGGDLPITARICRNIIQNNGEFVTAS